MKENYCSVCLSPVADEDAPVLAISGAGIPRCLCSECTADIETAEGAKDCDEALAAIDRLAKKLNDRNIDDPIVIATLGGIMKRSAERARLIKAGEYDFDKDVETDEDRELDAKDVERETKFDKVLNWVWAAILIGSVAFLVWYFLLK